MKNNDGMRFFDLSDRAKIEVAGPDAREFLTNLCTQDVKNLPVGETREAFLTTNKARVIAHVWIFHRESNFLLLDLAAGQGEKVMQHLNHYLISERAEVTDRTRELSLVRLVGSDTAVLERAAALVPLGQARRLAPEALAIDGIDLFCAADEFGPLKQRLIDLGAFESDSATYRVICMEAGLPEFGIDIDEARFAVEVNRTKQAICYTKGCYLGQETIVMARDRGQVNRLLMGVTIAEGEALASGTKLFRAGDEVGHITSSVFSPRLGQVIALAYLRRGNWDPDTQLIADGRTAIVRTLPFNAAP
ncbi:MAG: hypothetical protein HYX68_28515 [Planctomycetes bacterium]|nr:hypothetical protein [Planctomycetota bacterium]